jgi:hypothetical protein
MFTVLPHNFTIGFTRNILLVVAASIPTAIIVHTAMLFMDIDVTTVLYMIRTGKHRGVALSIELL